MGFSPGNICFASVSFRPSGLTRALAAMPDAGARHRTVRGRAKDSAGTYITRMRGFAEERNVSRAADRLPLSQPAVSRTLQRLRDMFHHNLFVRTAAGYELKLQAQRLLQELEAILPKLDHLLSGSSFRSGCRAGEVPPWGHRQWRCDPGARVVPRGLGNRKEGAPRFCCLAPGELRRSCAPQILTKSPSCLSSEEFMVS